MTHQFQNVLVGINVAQLEDPGSATFSPPVEEAIRKGLWLAQKSAARLTFLAVIDSSDQSLDILGAGDQKRVLKTLQNVTNSMLDRLVERAKVSGVDAVGVVRSGRSSYEIIQQVHAERHDLVIVGTRDLRMVKRILFGSTAMKLLRKCPCPVWVTKPAAASRKTLANIAVASDFTPVTDLALEAAISLAGWAEGHVHLVTSVDFPLDRSWSTELGDKTTDKYHQAIRTRAATGLRRQLSRSSDGGKTGTVETHILEGRLNPDLAILKFVKDYKIDLVTMGTIGRSGAAGIFIGNTAERLLPQLSCSVLAFKPADFSCPVTAEGAESLSVEEAVGWTPRPSVSN